MKIDPSTKIWLSFGNDTFMLPVNPKKVEAKKSADPDEFDIVGKGQIAVPQYPNLRSVKFKSFFPDHTDDPFTIEEAKEPDYYIGVLENAMNEATVGTYTIYRDMQYNESFSVIITSFSYSDEGGEPLDIYYSIELEEYKPYKAEKIVIKKKKKKKKTTGNVWKERAVKKKKVRVGAKVVVNGKYWYTSQGAKPFGTAKNLKTEVKRIVKGAKYPICVGHYGWVKESQLQVKS